MARYATDEEKHECPDCSIKFTIREAKNIGTNPLKPLYQCPCCNDSFVMKTKFDNGEPAIVWGKSSLWDEARDPIVLHQLGRAI